MKPKVFPPSTNKIHRGYTSTHRGYDIDEQPDSGVYCCQNGVIIQRVDRYVNAWRNTGKLTIRDYGNYIKVKHNDGSFSLYAHLKKGSSFVVGTQVIAGQIIARIGNTGNSTGNHVHFEYRTSANKSIPVEFVDELEPILPEETYTEQQWKDLRYENQDNWDKWKATQADLEQQKTITKEKTKELNQFIETLAKKLTVVADKAEVIGATERLLEVEDQLKTANKGLLDKEKEYLNEKTELVKRIESLEEVVEDQLAENATILEDLTALKDEVKQIKQREKTTNRFKNIIAELLNLFKRKP